MNSSDIKDKLYYAISFLRNLGSGDTYNFGVDVDVKREELMFECDYILKNQLGLDVEAVGSKLDVVSIADSREIMELAMNYMVAHVLERKKVMITNVKNKKIGLQDFFYELRNYDISYTVSDELVTISDPLKGVHMCPLDDLSYLRGYVKGHPRLSHFELPRSIAHVEQMGFIKNLQKKNPNTLARVLLTDENRLKSTGFETDDLINIIRHKSGKNYMTAQTSYAKNVTNMNIYLHSILPSARNADPDYMYGFPHPASHYISREAYLHGRFVDFLEIVTVQLKLEFIVIVDDSYFKNELEECGIMCSTYDSYNYPDNYTVIVHPSMIQQGKIRYSGEGDQVALFKRLNNIDDKIEFLQSQGYQVFYPYYPEIIRVQHEDKYHYTWKEPFQGFPLCNHRPFYMKAPLANVSDKQISLFRIMSEARVDLLLTGRNVNEYINEMLDKIPNLKDFYKVVSAWKFGFGGNIGKIKKPMPACYPKVVTVQHGYFIEGKNKDYPVIKEILVGDNDIQTVHYKKRYTVMMKPEVSLNTYASVTASQVNYLRFKKKICKSYDRMPISQINLSSSDDYKNQFVPKSNHLDYVYKNKKKNYRANVKLKEQEISKKGNVKFKKKHYSKVIN